MLAFGICLLISLPILSYIFTCAYLAGYEEGEWEGTAKLIDVMEERRKDKTK